MATHFSTEEYEMMECQICHGELKLRMLCIRCRRYICSECWDPRWGLCRECGIYKSELLNDRIRQLEYLDRYWELAREYLQRGCESCEMLRELLLGYLKLVKQLERESDYEGYQQLKPRLEQLRSQLTQACLRMISKQALSSQLEEV